MYQRARALLASDMLLWCAIKRAKYIQSFGILATLYYNCVKANCTDYSIYGAQVELQFVLLITFPAANYNQSLLKH